VAATAVLAVVHGSHEDTSTALGLGALAAETLDLAVTVDLVVLEDSELGLLALVLDLLGGGVDLLLPLLATTTQAQDQVEGRLLLDVVVRKGAAVLELLASEDETLLVRGNALLVCAGQRCSAHSAQRQQRTLDLGLHIVDGVGRLHLKGDGLAREGLDENLHGDLRKLVEVAGRARARRI
jgi:hypothetical protein